MKHYTTMKNPQSTKHNLQEQLLEALRVRDLKMFCALLKNPHVNPLHKYGPPHWLTCLEIASQNAGCEEFVTALLQSGVEPNVNTIIWEPIHHAAAEGHASTLKVLLHDTRTKVNAVDNCGRTALHLAAKHFGHGEDVERYERCIALLISCPDMDVNHCNKKGCTAVYEAAYYGGREAVLAMLKHGSHVLDLDSSHGVGLSARDIITEYYPDLKSTLPLPRIKHHDSNGHTQLLAAFQHRQLNAFHNILCEVNIYGNVCINPNFWYSKPYNSTCLEMACKEIGCEEFVRALLLAGADPNTFNIVTHKSPLHLTAEAGNYEAMKILLEARQVNVNMADGCGRTALHIAMEQHRGNDEDSRRLLQCISLLLEQESIDLSRTDNNGYSVIDLAAIRRNDSDAVQLMLKHHGLELDVNSFQGTQQIRKSEIITEKLLDIKRVLSQKNDAEKCENILKDTLFQHLYKRESQEFIRIFKEKVNKHATLVVQEFEDRHCTCLQYASNYGLQDVVKVLLEYDADPNATTDYEKRPPIVLACIRQNQDILQNFLDLSPESSFNINATDAKGNTALHYAVQRENLPTVIALLSHGADIKIRNIFDWPPLPPAAAGRLFNHCLQASHHFPDDKDYEIIFNYGLLLASHRQENVGKAISTDTTHAIENQDQESLQDRRKIKTLTPEMNLLYYLSQSQEHRHLLSHPIIASFLHLKWFRIRAIYYTNLALYVLFLILLNIYIFMDNGLLDPHLTFMNEPMHNISDGKNTSEGEHQETHLERFWTTYRNLIWFLLLFILLCHAVREQFKFVVSPAKYLLTLDSMLDIALVFTTTTVLLKSWDEDNYRKLFKASSLFLSWVELALIMGRLPNLSINIEMLKSVVRHYSLVLSSYFFFIIAFAVTFYIFCHDSDTQAFKTPWAAVKNTIMLLTGGIHVLSGNGHSSVVLLLFAFIIIIVMLNVLTGIAVFDVKLIHDNAEMLQAVSRITLLYEIESVLIYWNTFMEKICQFHCASKMATYLNNALRRVILFPNTSTSDKKISVFPNKSAAIIFNNKENSVTCKMNTKTLQAAINTISNQDHIKRKYTMKS